jgi:type VI protein secretion system component VasK
MEKCFAVPTRARLEKELSAIIPTDPIHHPPSVDDSRNLFTRLAEYLAMTERARIAQDWEQRAMTDAWAGAIFEHADAADEAALGRHVKLYIELVKRGEIPPWNPDQNLVQAARGALKQTTRNDADYAVVLREANEHMAPISRVAIFRGAAFASFVTSKSPHEVVVPGAYTRLGWEAYMRDGLDKELAKKQEQDTWVLGLRAPSNLPERTLDCLRSRYFEEYRNAWKNFLTDLDVRQPASNAEVLTQLRALEESPWPYLIVLQTLAENTRLETPSPGEKSVVMDALRQRLMARSAPDSPVTTPGGCRDSARGVEDSFAPLVLFGVPANPGQSRGPTGLSAYMTVVEQVVAVLEAQRIKADSKAATTAFESACRQSIDLLDRSQNSDTLPLISSLVLSPFGCGSTRFLAGAH